MRTRTLVSTALVLVLLGAAGVVAGLYAGEADPAGTPAATDEPTKLIPPPRGLSLPAAREPRPVLGGPAGPAVDGASVQARLAPLLDDRDLGAHVGLAVHDPTRDRPILTIGGRAPFTPASTTKLFTAAAVLSVLGPDHRFETTVALDEAGSGPPTVVLIGGGDPLLTRRQPDAGAAYAPAVSSVVSVDRLAADAAAALQDAGVGRVRVGWDTSLFDGPRASPNWEPSYVPDQVVSPISALWVDEGRLRPGFAARSENPAAAAAAELVKGLQRNDIRVDGKPRATPGAAGDEIASGQGAPLEEVVAHVLEVSDNEGAEVLFRQAALATGRPGSFAGGRAAVREVLAGLEVPWDDMALFDGSGLSRRDRVTLDAETAVLSLGADPDRPELRTVVRGLPVARFNGSLSSRFTSPASAPGRGVVRAKTGTLTGVHALAGAVVTRDGTLLVFSLLTDRVRPVDTLDARAQLDRIAAALAGCGCRRAGA